MPAPRKDTWKRCLHWNSAGGGAGGAKMTNGGKRLYQCPGCWSYLLLPLLNEGYECECGEYMTLIDLRNGALAEVKRERREQLLHDLAVEGSARCCYAPGCIDRKRVL